ncbi:GID complex subunit containing RING finger motif [Orbilia ellipsospora]|uniref:GID complex subunit containing RING finger motif n=1 Tax=Orbilia ellipsospora TaxID=2528407 RepID=A0AAV9XP23_9PEZI
MMATKTSATLNPETHLLLDQPLLRLPHEVLRKIFKTSQKYVEQDAKRITDLAKDAASKSDSPEASLATLNTMITRIQGLKRKMETLHEDEKAVHLQSRKRTTHLNDLYSLSSLLEDGYGRWSKVRLDRLLVDYMLRNGYSESAKKLAQEKDIEGLVDVDVFLQCWSIEESLRKKSTVECLAWCQDNKNALKKIKSTLEFELRLQQYIELVRARKLSDAVSYARKHLSGNFDTHKDDFHRASCMLAFPPERPGPYKDLYAESRWDHLVKTFVATHHNLYNIPQGPLLHVALSAGLSALKTPSCHSALQSRSNTASTVTSLCPICSMELNNLAIHVPYGHHTTSWVEHDLVVLPNGRVYGTKRLEDLASKLGLEAGRIKDPITGEEWDSIEVRKVFIS